MHTHHGTLTAWSRRSGQWSRNNARAAFRKTAGSRYMQVACCFQAILFWLLVISSVHAQTPLWVGDFETGNLSQFQNAPWNYVPTAATVVSSPRTQGNFAGRYVIPAGGNRC